MQKLDVAVVIVSYKSAKLAIDALKSVHDERAKATSNIRVVVVDNASGDEERIASAVTERFWGSWVELVAAPRNGGFAYGNNLGIRAACNSGIPDYVYLLNPDAQVRPGAIQTLIDFLETHPETGIAGSSFETVDGKEWPYAFRFPGLISEVISGIEIGFATRMLRRWEVARSMPHVNQPIDWICGASMMIRWEVLSSIGGMDENYFLYFEETDFCRRARQAGFSTWYVPDSRVMHIMGQSTSVTDVKAAPARFPEYWFQSRNRYFAVTYGVGRAMLIDILAIIARTIGNLKHLILGRSRRIVPHYVRDLIKYSVLQGKNRQFPNAKTTIFIA